MQLQQCHSKTSIPPRFCSKAPSWWHRGARHAPLLYSVYSSTQGTQQCHVQLFQRAIAHFVNCLTVTAVMVPFRNMNCYLRKAQGQNNLRNSRKTSRCGKKCIHMNFNCIYIPCRAIKQYSHALPMFQEEHRSTLHAGWV